MGGPAMGNGRVLESGTVRADIMTPSWVRRDGFWARIERLRMGRALGAGDAEDSRGDDEPEDMSDRAFLEKHEPLALEERQRWSGYDVGKGQLDKGSGGGEGVGKSVKKRGRSGSLLRRKSSPLFPTPLECWNLVESAKTRHSKEAGSIRMAEKMVRRRRRALAAVEAPVHSFSNVETVIQREILRIKKTMRKVSRERSKFGESKRRSATMSVLESAAATLQATDHSFRQNSQDFMDMMKSLASKANTTLTIPISFTSIYKDLVATRKALEASKMDETNLSLGAFIKLELDKKKYPELFTSLFLRDGYRLVGSPRVERDVKSDGVGSSQTENELLDAFEETNAPADPKKRPSSQHLADSEDPPKTPGGFSGRFGSPSDPSTPKEMLESPGPFHSPQPSPQEDSALTSEPQIVSEKRATTTVPELNSSRRGVELTVTFDGDHSASRRGDEIERFNQGAQKSIGGTQKVEYLERLQRKIDEVNRSVEGGDNRVEERGVAEDVEIIAAGSERRAAFSASGAEDSGSNYPYRQGEEEGRVDPPGSP